MGFAHERFSLLLLPKYFFLRLLNLLAYLSLLSYLTVLLQKLRGVKIGKKVFIGRYVVIDEMRPDLITIGDHAGITTGTVIITHRFDMSRYKEGMPIMDIPYQFAPVVIEEGAFIGMQCVVLPGVRIGKGAIVGANSLVNSDIPDGWCAAGNPIKLLHKVGAPDKTTGSDA